MNYLGQFNFNDFKKKYTLNMPQNYDAEQNHQKKVIILHQTPHYSQFNMFSFNNSKSKGCGSCGKR